MLPINIIQRLRPLICPLEPLSSHVPAGSSVLDVGCGRGAFLLHLLNHGKVREGLGIDVSESAIRVARRSVPGAGELRFLTSGEASVMPARPWDVVSMIDVLHHIPQRTQEAFVADALLGVKPGGIFLYKDMCSRPFWRAVMNRLHDLLMARQWIHYVQADRLESWVVSRGFALEHSESYTRFWYGHELRVFRKHV